MKKGILSFSVFLVLIVVIIGLLIYHLTTLGYDIQVSIEDKKIEVSFRVANSKK